MRQAQQNRRGRGRNRKGQNPLTRSFESNGPDIKIRGTASHVAEKYVSLARDALASGDPVLAENYLQHAEHYNRIIMTFREQQTQGAGEAMNGNGRHRSHSDSDLEQGDEVVEDAVSAPQPRGSEPQPELAAVDHDEPAAPRRNAPRRENRSTDDGEAREGGRANGRGRRQRYMQGDDQPEFLKRPVRRPRRAAAEQSAEGDADNPGAEGVGPADQVAE